MKKILYVLLPLSFLILLGSCETFSDTNSYENLQATNEALQVELTAQSAILATQNAQADQLPTQAAIQSTPTLQNTGETEIRYLIAHIQLYGGDEYYPYPTSSVEAQEALHRWNMGIRVENISQFELKQLTERGIYKVVYLNTLTEINGMDVVLTEGISPLCNHPFWPIKDEAVWEYAVEHSGYGKPASGNSTERWTLQLGDDGASFRLEIDNLDFDSDRTELYQCTENGIVRAGDPMTASNCTRDNGCIWLPAQTFLSPGYRFSVDTSGGGGASFNEVGIFESVSVPAGTFDTQQICIGIIEGWTPCGQVNTGQSVSWDLRFAKDVGLVRKLAIPMKSYGIYLRYELISYSIP